MGTNLDDVYYCFERTEELSRRNYERNIASKQTAKYIGRPISNVELTNR